MCAWSSPALACIRLRVEHRFGLSGAVVTKDAAGTSNSARVTTRTYRMPKRLGPYQHLRKLGRGAMQYVLQGVADSGPLSGRDVALKVLAPHQLTKPAALAQWRNEVRAGLAIRHPHVVATFDVGETDLAAGSAPTRWAYLVQELVPDGDLAQLQDHLGGRLPPILAVRLTMAVARGLTAVHQAGWVHRDLKPSNILLERRPGAGWLPKISDFGLAVHADEVAAGQVAGQLAGTPAFMAPEQLAGGDVDGRTDCYAWPLHCFIW